MGAKSLPWIWSAALAAASSRDIHLKAFEPPLPSAAWVCSRAPVMMMDAGRSEPAVVLPSH